MKFVQLADHASSAVFERGRLLILDSQSVRDVLNPSVQYKYPTWTDFNDRFEPATRETFLTTLTALEARLVEDQNLVTVVKTHTPPAIKPGDFNVGDQVFVDDGHHVASPYVVKLLTPKYAILDGYGGEVVFGRDVLGGWSRIENSYVLALRKDLIRKPEYER